MNTNAPPNATSEQARPFFDWFSWESFIALNWPAAGTGRGNPDQPNNPSVFAARKLGTKKGRVWPTPPSEVIAPQITPRTQG